MNKNDQDLGMKRPITRRDFIQDSGIVALGSMGLGLSPSSTAENDKVLAPSIYPPTRTGLRGSHTGSYEIAHALRDGVALPDAKVLNEHYDLVVVGGGISGLAAALYYQKRFGIGSKILILENHDDFGGHARRNEFHHSGQMRLSMGGTHNLEHWQFSETVNDMMKDLGIDHEKLRSSMQFRYGFTARNGPAMWFDKATYGTDKLVTGYTLESWTPDQPIDCIDEFPLSDEARNQLKWLYTTNTDVMTDKSKDEAEAILASISYPDFLRQYGRLGEEALQLFNTCQHGAWGLELRALSAREGLAVGLPGLNLLDATDHMKERDYPVAMFPDGNASVARLMLQRLIPKVAPGANVNNVAMLNFDYGKLDSRDSAVRLRLESTVVNVKSDHDKVTVAYASGSAIQSVTSSHCVMACYHAILPYLMPDLPAPQKAAQKKVKMPLILANVLIKSSKALDKLGIDQVRCPGRMFRSLFMFKGINTGGYSHPLEDDGPVPLVFWGSISPPPEAETVFDQLRGSRQKMLSISFEDYEREIRAVLDGLLSPAGFDTNEDILAITVNRWPHGYAYQYMDLWDEDYEPGKAPHQIASKPYGRVTFANADAGALAYTHTAIDEAWRSVKELPAA